MRWDTVGRAAENIRVSRPLAVKELESNLVGNAKPEKTFEWARLSYELFCFVLFRVSRDSGWLQIYYGAKNDPELLSFWSSCLNLPRVDITGECYHAVLGLEARASCVHAAH